MNGTLLIIDDDRLVLDRAEEALTKVGCTVFTSQEPGLPDGIDPDELDLVLLDVNMPDFFGDDLAQILPDLGVAAPIYFYSSVEEKRLKELVSKTKARGYIRKSQSFTEMADEVLAILGSHR